MLQLKINSRFFKATTTCFATHFKEEIDKEIFYNPIKKVADLWVFRSDKQAEAFWDVKSSFKL